MSREVDTKVVEMEFDNKQFESGAQTSLSTIEKLKKSLRFEDSAKGLVNLGKAARDVDVSGLGAGVELARSRFSALEIAGVTALMNITNRAVDAGIQLAKSLSVDQIAAGWQKFSDKTTSVATLVSQGYSLEAVNQQLEKLNWFTDETSYAFTDMVANIAKFTASGQDLETSVTALEGIANWAALSGQNASTASRAMYQLSQAMGAGVMRKEDYKSIQNVSMDTDEFRQKALDAGVALGTLKQNADGTYKSLMANTEAFSKNQFAEHLTQDAWFTSDVMMKVYSDYASAVNGLYDLIDSGQFDTASEAMEAIEKEANDYVKAMNDIGKEVTFDEALQELGYGFDSFALKALKAAQEARTWEDVVDATKDAVSTGWMKTFEIIFGDYQEAKTLFTQMANDFYDIFAAGSEDRNALLLEGLSTGWKQFISEGISDAEGLKSEIISVAKESGISIDELIDSSGSFEESLHEGWLTSDILATSVSNLTDRLEGMSEEERKAEGYSQQQFEALKKVNEEIESGEINVDEYVSKMQEISGRENLVQSLFNLRDAFFLVDEETEKATGLLAIIKEAFREIFPPITAERLKELTVGIREFTEKLIPSEETADRIKNVFMGLFSVFDLVGQCISAVFRTISPLFGIVAPVISSLLSFFGDAGSSFSDFVSSMKENDTVYNTIQQVIIKISNLASNCRDVFTNAFGFVKPLLDGVASFFQSFIASFGGFDVSKITTISDAFRDFWNGLKPFESVGSFFEKAFSGLKNIFESLVPVFSALGSVAGKLFGGIKDAVVNMLTNFNMESFITTINGLLTGGLLLKLQGFIDSLNKAKQSSNGGIGGGLKDIFSGITNSLSELQNSIKASSLLKIAAAIGIIALSVMALSSIEPDALNTSLSAVTLLFADLIGTMAGFQKIANDSSGKAFKRMASALLSFSAAILVLSIAMKMLSALSWDEVIRGLVSIGLMTVILVKAADALSKNSDRMIKGAINLIPFAIAMRILASSVKTLGQLQYEELAKGLIGVGVMIVAIAGFIKQVDGKKFGVGSGVGLIAMAAALLILANVVKSLGNIPVDMLLTGLGGLAALLIGLAFALQNMPNDIIGKGVGLVILASAMTILAGVISKIGGMRLEQLAVGLVGLGASLLIIVAAMRYMESSIGDAAVLLVISMALVVLAGALKIMGSMSLPEVGKALLSVAGTFIILGVAGLVLGPMVPVLLALAGAVVLLGIGMLAAGTGVLFFAIALTTLSASATAAAGASVFLVSSILSLLPLIVSTIGQVIIAIAEAIKEAAPAVAGAIVSIISTLLPALNALIPNLLSFASNLIVSLCGFLLENAPILVETGLSLFTCLLQGIADNIEGVVVAAALIVINFINGISQMLPQIIQTGITFVIAFTNGLANGIRENTGPIFEAVNNLVSALIELVLTGLQNIVRAIPGVGEGLADELEKAKLAVRNTLAPQSFEDSADQAAEALSRGFTGNSGSFASAGETVVDAGLDAIDDSSQNFKAEGENLGQSAIDGLLSTAPDLSSTSNSMFGEAIDGIDVSGMAEGVGIDMGDNVISGLLSNESDFSAAGTDMGEYAIDGLDSMSGLFSSSGKDSGEAFASGIEGTKSSARSAGDSIASSGSRGSGSHESSFRSSGSYAGAGFVKGVESKENSAYNAGWKLGKASLRGTNDAIKVSSPSKEFAKTGGFAGMGYIIGLKRFAGRVRTASSQVGEESLYAMQLAVSRAGSILDGTMEMDPTIRPVIDLTNVRSGINSIDAMMPSSYAVGVDVSRPLEAVGDISARTARIQNGKLDESREMLDAIRGIKIPETGDTYQIDGITYGDGTEVADAVKTLIRAIRVERRV